MRIGRFELRSGLPGSGLCEAWIGLDEVVIKLLREFEGIDRKEFEGELETMARLSHPNVVRIHEFGDHEGRLFFVMELVDGITLQEWLWKGPRTQDEILEVFVAAGRGLAALHERGLVQRNFRPGNVMIARDGRAMIMDPEPEVAGPDALRGNPSFLAPEQILGRRAEMRTDQFSFCLSLWLAVDDEWPFPSTIPAQLHAKLKGELTIPRKVGVRSELRRALERGLQPEPGARWPSMHALLDALGDHQTW